MLKKIKRERDIKYAMQIRFSAINHLFYLAIYFAYRQV